MKRIVLLSALIFAASATLTGQTKPSEVETTYGSCSPNLAHNAGSVTINCRGLDPAVAAQIVQIVNQVSALNKKTATEKNQQAMKRTLRQIQNELETALAQPSTQITGPIVQSSSGNCSPNIVGSNNTNICGPQALRINDDQAAELTRRISSIPSNIPRGLITVKVEASSHQADVAGTVLARALQNAGLNVKFERDGMIIADPDNLGGITFIQVGPAAEPMAQWIGMILQKAGVVSGPVPAFSFDAAPQSPDFTILVRKPQE